jgi:cyd operon protein YbgT
MWYFSWILGVLLACSLGIINVLRLEAQEALAKENVVVDPLTQLLARESILERLQEKVENSKRNEMPFSLMYLSLTDFKMKHQLAEHEMDTTVLKVVASIKNDIRVNLDISARVGDEDFLLALPGASLERAEIIAKRMKKNIFVNVKTPGGIAVEIGIGVVEYFHHSDLLAEELMMGVDEIEALLNIVIGKCFESTMA